ncbi:MAG TPA: HIT family protein [Nitrospira sp.]|nr:HIT family protein [Nitrospira sp.]
MAEGNAAVTDPSCKACSGAWPQPDHLIVELGLTRAYLHDDQFFPGWTVLVLKRHATELFQLTAAERASLIEEVTLIAKVLAQVFEAHKMNYELLGNQLPHIHWHVIPRSRHDPAPLSPVWLVHHDQQRLSLEALDQRLHAIQAGLEEERKEAVR